MSRPRPRFIRPEIRALLALACIRRIADAIFGDDVPPRYESALTEILIALAAIDEDGVFPLDAPRLLTLGEGLAREIPGAADEGEKLLRYLEALEAA